MQDVIKINPSNWITDVVYVNIFSQQDIDSNVAVELLELKENDALMTSVESED